MTILIVAESSMIIDIQNCCRYNFSWYDIPVKSQKLLLYVIRGSMKPNFLSAGKLYILSLKNFTTVKIIHKCYVFIITTFEIFFNNVFLFKVVHSSVSYFIVLASLK